MNNAQLLELIVSFAKSPPTITPLFFDSKISIELAPVEFVPFVIGISCITISSHW